jgi:opacity protein-like surface antigen
MMRPALRTRQPGAAPQQQRATVYDQSGSCRCVAANLIIRVFVCLTGVSTAVSADAQVRPDREVFAHVGWARSYDDEGWIGSGVYAGAGAAIRLSRRWNLRGEFDYLHHHRDRYGFRSRGDGLFLMGNFIAHFRPDRRTQPYILFGPGLLVYRNRLLDSTSAGLALNAGFGVRTRVSGRVFLRPEMRMTLAAPGRHVVDNLQAFSFTMGAGYGW